MTKYIILLVLCLVWVVPCLAEEKGYLTEAYEDVYRQSQRIRERNQDIIIQRRELERQQAEWERNYEGDDGGWEYHYDYETDRSTWEKDGMIIGDD